MIFVLLFILRKNVKLKITQEAKLVLSTTVKEEKKQKGMRVFQ